MQCSFSQAESHLSGPIENVTDVLTNVGLNVASAFGTMQDALFPKVPSNDGKAPAWIVPAGIAAGGLLLLALMVSKSGGRK